ncbi:ankyrin repeat domain-containing protein 27 [Trichonephila clavipes]|nr:ankyrin repeat domain-containing protein 27 [Trichonephila clavipes]
MGLQFLFMDDNAPCHRTVAAEQLLESEDIERMDWPARSPDLNPIEHVWDFLGRPLAARTLPPVTIRELRLALQDEWAAMPQQLFDTLILSMGRRCETCLAIRGDHIPYLRPDVSCWTPITGMFRPSTKYADKLKEAQKKLWLICVPFHKSLKGVTITKEFVDTHVLKPSPFFKSHFITTDINNPVSFEIEDDYIITPKETIKILSEETAYNDDYKPYRILITDAPLCLSKVKDELHSSSCSKNGLKLSLNECSSFLSSFPECPEVMKILDKKIQVFNSSYMVLPQYLQDASHKLRGMLNWAVKEFCRSLEYRAPDEYSKTEISSALENYIMFYVHDKVFPVIKKFCLEEDRRLTQKLLSLYEANVTPDQLGVRESFCCQTPSAVVELASLNSRKSPTEKLNCFMKTLTLENRQTAKQSLYDKVDNALHIWFTQEEDGETAEFLTDDDIAAAVTQEPMEEEWRDDETQCDKKDVVPHADGAAAFDLTLRYLEQQPDTTPADVLFMRRWRNYALSKRLSSLRQKKITELM